MGWRVQVFIPGRTLLVLLSSCGVHGACCPAVTGVLSPEIKQPEREIEP
jgi:hypothetical protein